MNAKRRRAPAEASRDPRRLLRYERRTEPLLQPAEFAARVLAHTLWGAAVVLAALAIGVLGYHFLAGLSWLDALLNASMILSGMGPVDSLVAPRAKLFAAGYALFSGVVFVAAVGLVLAPVLHRLLHSLHLDDSPE